MSFTSTIRDELCGLAIKPLCCRRAFLYGLIYAGYAEGDTVMADFSVLKEAVHHPHEQAAHLVHTLFSREAETVLLTRGAHRYASVNFSFKKAAEKLVFLARLPS